MFRWPTKPTPLALTATGLSTCRQGTLEPDQHIAHWSAVAPSSPVALPADTKAEPSWRERHPHLPDCRSARLIVANPLLRFGVLTLAAPPSSVDALESTARESMGPIIASDDRITLSRAFEPRQWLAVGVPPRVDACVATLNDNGLSVQDMAPAWIEIWNREHATNRAHLLVVFVEDDHLLMLEVKHLHILGLSQRWLSDPSTRGIKQAVTQALLEWERERPDKSHGGVPQDIVCHGAMDQQGSLDLSDLLSQAPLDA